MGIVLKMWVIVLSRVVLFLYICLHRIEFFVMIVMNLNMITSYIETLVKVGLVLHKLTAELNN